MRTLMFARRVLHSKVTKAPDRTSLAATREGLSVGSRELEGTARFDLPRGAIAAAPLLALGVFALLKWADWGSPREKAAEGGENELLVWESLITAQVVLWAVLAGVGLRALRQLHLQADGWFAEALEGRRARWRRETAGFLGFTYSLIGALFVLGAFTSARVNNPPVLNGQSWKVPLLFALAAVAIFPFLVVLKTIQLCAAETSGWSTSARDIERITVLRRRLRTATASLGTLVALYLISSGALGDATEAAGLEPVPDSIILVAGAWFTGILAALYLHVFSSVDGRARALLGDAAPLPDPSPAAADDFTKITNLRRELSGELELGGDARTNLEGLIAVLSPLAAALLNRFAGL